MESIPVPKLSLASRDDDEHQAATGLYILMAFDSYVLLINVDNPRKEPLLRDLANDGKVFHFGCKLGTQLKLDS